MIPSIDRYKTPYKLGKSVIEPSLREGAYDSLSTDVPFVFYHNDKFWMMHCGFNGQGYQTALACADQPEGPFEDVCMMLEHNEEGRWDSANAAGAWLLSTQDLFSTRTLTKWDGKYWLYYHSFPGDGYEEGAAAIGAAWCDKEDLSEWHRLEEPILTISKEAGWDHGGLYKNCVIEHDHKWYLFYNGKNETYAPWNEQIGLCIGDDPLHFTRMFDHPVMPIGEKGRWDGVFTAAPWVVYSKPDDCWVMFYYGFDNVKACDGIAFSKDLVHWEKFPEPLIVPGKEGELDSLYAHKPAMLWYEDTLYHYYCCVEMQGEEEHRTITVAANRPWKAEI